MMIYSKTRHLVFGAICLATLSLPLVSQAATDEAFAAMRAQLAAMAERLDRLEAENHALADANRELTKTSQQTAARLAVVSEKTDTVVANAERQPTTNSWTEKINWKGDFRYRFESFEIEGKADRNRTRIRARAAMIAKVTPNIQVGMGLASGGDDPVSTNQTLGGGGSSKGLSLDLAYFDYSGLANTNVLGGKFSNYVHKSGKNQLLWDGDWRPEGTGIKWSKGVFFANGLGTWIESDSKKDQSFAYLTQLGLNAPLGDSVKLTVGVGYHSFDIKGNSSYYGDDDDFYGNSFDPVTNTYLYDYEELELFADLGFTLFGRPAIVFANYVQNQAADDNDTAYIFGLNYGSAKNKGHWAFGYTYQKLEADAVFGLLTDSDFGGGGTDAKGHTLKGSYAIVKNVNANVTYFINETGLASGDPSDYKRLQLDVSFKY